MKSEAEVIKDGLLLIGKAISKSCGVEFKVQDEYLTLSNGKKDLVLKAILDEYIPDDEYVTFDLEDVESSEDAVVEFRADVVNEEEVDFDDNDINVIKTLSEYFS